MDKKKSPPLAVAKGRMGVRQRKGVWKSARRPTLTVCVAHLWRIWYTVPIGKRVRAEVAQRSVCMRILGIDPGIAT
ncbi:MAG: hypothetical protein RR426_05690, partial [Oscillospiraceae bacterium]